MIDASEIESLLNDQGIRHVGDGIDVQVELPNSDQLELLTRAQSLCECVRDETSRLISPCLPHQMLVFHGPKLEFGHHIVDRLTREEFIYPF